MILDLAKNTCAVARHIHLSNTHTKFGWISSNGLGRDSVIDRQTDKPFGPKAKNCFAVAY